MSEHFHVHGPHDHAVEHAAQGAQHGADDFASRIAVMTAILSTIGALFSYQGGATQNDALLQKNNAAISKAEASDQWNYYQAKGSKQNLSELAAALSQGETREHYQQETVRYKAEKDDIKKKAEAYEQEVKEYDRRSEEAMHQHHRWAQSMTAVQIAISLAAITLLTRKRWLYFGAYGVAGIGALLAGAAFMHI
jgi:hypothetical protein